MEPAHAHPRPKAVILIRHAEKPEKKHKWWLNKKGQRRALYLAWYLRKRGPLATLLNRMGLRDASEPIAEAIFAMRQTQRKDGSFRSDRSRQTVQPYARRLMKTGRLANEDFHRWEHKGFRHEFAFEKGREEEMVDYINQYYWGCRVLIAWQHKNIKKVPRLSCRQLSVLRLISALRLPRSFVRGVTRAASSGRRRATIAPSFSRS